MIEPVFAQFVQAASGKALYGFDTLLSNPDSLDSNWCSLVAWLVRCYQQWNKFLVLEHWPWGLLGSPCDRFGTTHHRTLILVKGALDARGSKLMPDKKDFGFAFPCDGPGRGGTCDISAWDSFYLAMFWMLNTLGWLTFYWHWKHLGVWQGNVATVQRKLYLPDGLVP